MNILQLREKLGLTNVELMDVLGLNSLRVVERLIARQRLGQPPQSHWSLVFCLCEEDLNWVLKIIANPVPGESVALVRDRLKISQREMAFLLNTKTKSIESLEASERGSVRQHWPSLRILLRAINAKPVNYGVELILRAAEKRASSEPEQVMVRQLKTKLFPRPPG